MWGAVPLLFTGRSRDPMGRLPLGIRSGGMGLAASNSGSWLRTHRVRWEAAIYPRLIANVGKGQSWPEAWGPAGLSSPENPPPPGDEWASSPLPEAGSGAGAIMDAPGRFAAESRRWVSATRRRAREGESAGMDRAARLEFPVGFLRVVIYAAGEVPCRHDAIFRVFRRLFLGTPNLGL